MYSFFHAFTRSSATDTAPDNVKMFETCFALLLAAGLLPAARKADCIDRGTFLFTSLLQICCHGLLVRALDDSFCA
jgi:hypothetical protein